MFSTPTKIFPCKSIRFPLPNVFRSSQEVFDAYRCHVFAHISRDQDILPEPPQKKQKVASKKAAVVKEKAADKRAAEPSASERSSPPPASEPRSKQLQDRPAWSGDASGHVSDYLLFEAFEYNHCSRYFIWSLCALK